MAPIVAFPAVVLEAAERLRDLFANEPERVHFAEYLTGLFVAGTKNVSAINREFAVTTDQSCLNRWLTRVDWDPERLNRERLAWLQESPDTRYARRGVIAIDNVLVDHDGTLIEDVGYFWDHSEKRSKLAHDYLISNYVCPSGKHYPLAFHRFIKEEQCREVCLPFRDHHVLFQNLVDRAVQQGIPGDFTFDNWFTCHRNLNHIHARGRHYVADLKFNRHVVVKGEDLRASDWAQRIAPKDRTRVTIRGRHQWYFTASLRIPDVEHPVRIVVVWRTRRAQAPYKILVTDGTKWEINRITRVYCGRWRGTECLHRDGKQHLGLGDCRLRNGPGHTRHVHMVFLAHSVLMRQLHSPRSRSWASEYLTTIGEACRAVTKDVVARLIDWIVQRACQYDWSAQKIKEYLAVP